MSNSSFTADAVRCGAAVCRAAPHQLWTYLYPVSADIIKNQYANDRLLNICAILSYTLCSKNVHLFIFWITLILGTLNPEKIDMNTLHTDLSTSPIRCSHFTLGNPKKVIFNSIIHTHFWLFMLSQKKTNRKCCTAASAVYLRLFSASYYLHSSSTASAAHYRRSACIDMDVLRLAAAACCDMGWISA